MFAVKEVLGDASGVGMEADEEGGKMVLKTRRLRVWCRVGPFGR